jgi:hypothetical protein
MLQASNRCAIPSGKLVERGNEMLVGKCTFALSKRSLPSKSQFIGKIAGCPAAPPKFLDCQKALHRMDVDHAPELAGRLRRMKYVVDAYMASYDSDVSDGGAEDFTETSVLLGYASKDAAGETVSRLGGRPVCSRVFLFPLIL